MAFVIPQFTTPEFNKGYLGVCRSLNSRFSTVCEFAAPAAFVVVGALGLAVIVSVGRILMACYQEARRQD